MIDNGSFLKMIACYQLAGINNLMQIRAELANKYLIIILAMNEEERAKEIGQISIKSSELEQILKSKFNAQGDGLGQQLRSVENSLPPELFSQLKWIVTIRNKAIHEAHTFKMPNGFIQDCDRAKMMLEQIEAPAGEYMHNNSQSYRQERGYSPLADLTNQVMVGVFGVVGEYVGMKLPQNRSMPSSALSFIISGCSLMFKFFFQYLFWVFTFLIYAFALIQIFIGNFVGGDFKFLIGCLIACYGIASIATAKLYGIDRSAQNRGKMRMPESFLHFAEILGGWPVLFISQQAFRKSDSNEKYQFVFNTILIFHTSLIINIFLFHGLLWWINLPILFLVFVATLIDLVRSSKLM
jgi:uncharacterized membrane protein YsdA (DUF1294 family)